MLYNLYVCFSNSFLALAVTIARATVEFELGKAEESSHWLLRIMNCTRCLFLQICA